MGSNGSRYVPKQVKAETAALGFRVKSGWAAVVLVSDAIDSPGLCGNRVIDLSDSRFPETRQPYYAAMGKLETEAKEINRRTDIVQRVAKQSVTELLANYRQKGYAIARAWLEASSILQQSRIHTFARTRSRAGYLTRCSRRLYARTRFVRPFLSSAMLMPKRRRN